MLCVSDAQGRIRKKVRNDTAQPRGMATILRLLRNLSLFALASYLLALREREGRAKREKREKRGGRER
jgi:hypothetical protein